MLILDDSMKHGAWTGKIASLLSLLILVFPASGCVGVRQTTGIPPDTSVLETGLRPEISTRADVVSTLGEPDGKGKAALYSGDTPRTIWSYFYEEGNLREFRRIYLFVFFNKDCYDGYMWFSSLPK